MSGSNKKFKQAVQYEVTVAGETYSQSDAKVTDMVVETTLEGADRFSMTLLFPFDRKNKEYPDMDWEKFTAGKGVDIKLGWAKEGELEPVFKGKIRQVKSSFSDEKGATVGLSGYGLLHDMMRGTNDQSWKDAKVADVVEEVLGKTFGKKEVKGAKMKRTKIIQHNQSDYRLVKELADKYGYRFYANRDKAFFVPRSEVGGDEPVATLVHGTRLDSFSAEVNEATKVKKVEVRYWDMENEKEIVGSAEKDAGNDKKEVFRIPCFSKEEADEIAKNKLANLSSAKAAGHGEVQRGIPKINAGTTIEIEEMGEKFSTKYYVEKAAHRMSSSGYRTSFDVKEVPE